MKNDFQKDIISGFSVFLLALPLCLGIAFASHFPPVAGIICAIIGGLLASWWGGATLSIKGPAAGLIVIALSAVTELGYERTLAVGVVAAIIQIIIGTSRKASVVELMSPSIVHGMLVAIGIIIVSQQLYVMMGLLPAGEDTVQLLLNLPFAIKEAHPVILMLGVVSLLISAMWPLMKKFSLIPSTIVILIVTVPLSIYLNVDSRFLIAIPSNIISAVTFPDFSAIFSVLSLKYIVMFTLVGAIESLLTVCAINTMVTQDSRSDLNKDLVAVGIGNLASAFLGGIPMISEVVRSKANIDYGARSRLSNFYHGLFMLIAVVVFPSMINLIPLSALAALLVFVGLRLASPKEFIHSYHAGKDQFLIFAVTLIMTLLSDLLMGVMSGLILQIIIHFIRRQPNAIILNDLKHYDKQDIDRVFERIPEQGPLEFFVHHNTLHHYENMNFFDAVKQAALDYGTNAFMLEAFYFHKYQHGLITEKQLHLEISEFIARYHLQLSPDIILKLLINQTTEPNAHLRSRIKVLQNEYHQTKSVYYSEIIKEDWGIDIDYHTSTTIYRFMSSYFDFGSALWMLENREKGMWYHFCELHISSGLFDSKYRRTLSRQLKIVRSIQPELAITHFLQSLKIEGKAIEGFMFSLCLKHKGWAGFVKSLAEHPEYIKDTSIKPDLAAFLAIILACEYSAIATFSKDLISVPREKRYPLHNARFLSQYIDTYDQNPSLRSSLEKALPLLTDFNRQEIFHGAYENTLYQQFINAYPACKKQDRKPPTYQTILCMDDREESMRRYLEADPHCETFGSAGHFGLNIAFKGYFETRFRALCPVNVHPEYKISEKAKHSDPLKLKLIHLVNGFRRFMKHSSRGILGGYLASLFSSLLKFIPFAIDVIDPRINIGMKKRAHSFLQSAVTTELIYKKEDGALEGISLEKRECFAESFLSLIGLTNGFAPYIYIIGHGSMSLNNPHKAAYDCGACGGGIGAVNARLMAQILNEPEVRQGLVQRKIYIPDDTQFIGAYHNTCSDEVDFFDLPDDRTVDAINVKILEAGISDSQERSRRFKNLPLNLKPEFYFKAVQARAFDLRQPRAEYGHSTNALFIIGERAFTHDLFLDRRAFLLSYNYDQDKDLSILDKLLTATIPVISGINLEYFFSYLDNEFYGAGTKLPHNVNGLIGVINGHLSDLRAGLPWQMVEIHQPIRLFLLIIADVEKVTTLLSTNNSYNNIIHHEWIRLAVHDIKSNTVWLYQHKTFVQISAHDIAPDYLPQDEKILTMRNHLEFGHINYGN